MAQLRALGVGAARAVGAGGQAGDPAGVPGNPPGATPREALAAAVGFLVLAVVFTVPIHPSSRDLVFGHGDGLVSYFPYMLRAFQPADAQVAGAWDATTFTGLPEAHTPVGRYYPPTVVLYRFFPAALALGLAVWLHHAWAALGAYCLMRASGRSCAACFLAGLVFGFGGFMVFHRGHVPMQQAAAWFPWILCTMERYRRRKQPAWIVVAATCLAFQGLTGHLQMISIGGLVWLAYAAYFGLRSPREFRVRFLAGIAASCLLGAVGSLPQVLPLFEVAGRSDYARFDGDFFFSGSMKLRDLAGLASPCFFGGGFGVPRPKMHGLTEYGLFMGVLPLCLVLTGLARRVAHIRLHRPGAGDAGAASACTRTQISWRRAFGAWFGARDRGPTERAAGARQRSHESFWLLVLGVSLLLMLGKYTPVYRLFEYVPIYRLFHYPARYAVVFGLAFAWLAAWFFDDLGEIERAERGRAACGAVMAALVFAGVCVASLLSVPQRPAWPYPGYWVAAASAGTALVMVVSRMQRGWPRRLSTLLIPVLTFAELLFHIGRHDLGSAHVAGLVREADFPPVIRRLRDDRAQGVPPRVAIGPGFWEVAGSRFRMPGSFGSAWGVSVLNAYSQSAPRTLSRLLHLDRWGNADWDALLGNARGLSAAGGRYLITLEPLELGDDAHAALPYELVAQIGDQLHVYENRGARDLVQLVRSVEVVRTADEAAERALDRTAPPPREHAAVVADRDLREPAGATHVLAAGDLNVTGYSADQIACSTRTAGESFLVLVVTRAIGWTARIDGTPVRIHTVDGAWMGITIPAGEHAIRFTYCPVLVWAGAACAIPVFAVAWLWVACRCVRRRWPRSATAGAAAGPAARGLERAVRSPRSRGQG